MKKVLHIFSILNDRDIEWLSEHGKRKTVKPGQVLVERGVEIDAIYVVIEGVLEVQITDEQVEPIRLGAGEIVGEISIIDERPPSATVIAESDAKLIAIPRLTLLEKLDSDEGFASRFYRAIALFLATRMRGTISRFGYGGSDNSIQELEQDEFDLRMLEDVSIAGARFDRMVKHFYGR